MDLEAAKEALREKLNRAEEHIEQFKAESEAFLDAAGQRQFVGDDPQAAEAFRNLHRSRRIPARLSVLSGEAVQQMRSCLDHVVCALIAAENGRDTMQSQFPIFLHAPTTKKQIDRYESQLGAVKRDAVRAVIEAHQPYKRRLQHKNPKNHWLYILKEFSNRDKHRALLLHTVWPESRLNFTIDSRDGWTIQSSGPDEGAYPSVKMSLGGKAVKVVDMQRSITARIAFASWGETGRTLEVAWALTELHNAVVGVLRELIPFLC